MITLLGQKIKLETIILILVVGVLIGSNVWCSCSGGIYEGFVSAQNVVGATIDYSMGKGVPISWVNTDTTQPETPADWFNHLDGNIGNIPSFTKGVPLMFKDNKFDSSCCPSTYTNSSGCACVSPEQQKYLASRGGNR